MLYFVLCRSWQASNAETGRALRCNNNNLLSMGENDEACEYEAQMMGVIYRKSHEFTSQHNDIHKALQIMVQLMLQKNANAFLHCRSTYVKIYLKFGLIV